MTSCHSSEDAVHVGLLGLFEALSSADDLTEAAGIFSAHEILIAHLATSTAQNGAQTMVDVQEILTAQGWSWRTLL